MANIGSSFQSSFFLPILITLILTLPASTTANTKPQRLVTKLIHRDLIFPRSFYSEKDVESYLFAAGYIFLVNFSIGQPPVQQLAAMDTGSSLTWVQCAPCEPCMEQTSKRFNPFDSHTYRSVPCLNGTCPSRRLSQCHLDGGKQCTFGISYLDGSTSNGDIGTDHLLFEFDGDNTVIPDVLFGCGFKNSRGTAPVLMDGVFGLGSSEESIINQLGKRFSYCVGNINDPSYMYNTLAIGEGVTFEGYSTPFTVHEGMYYVTMEGISLGEDRLNIDRDAFKKSPRGGGVVIDSGGTISKLPEVVYSVVREKVSGLLDGTALKQVPGLQNNLLCYNGTSQELERFPALTFHLANEADLVLDVGSLFYRPIGFPDLICMSIRPVNTMDGESIIGIMAQQYYNVAFDLEGERIFFQRIDCELLDD